MRSSSQKRRRLQSRRRESRPTVPFPLQDNEGRLQAVGTLYEEPAGNRLASEMTALQGLREGHPELGAEELQRLNNQVLLMIAEYHLTSASQGTHHVLPVLPEGAARLMPPLDDYLPGSFDGFRDVRVTDRAQILHVAVWLHRLDLRTTYGSGDRCLTPGGGLRYRAPPGIFLDAQAFGHHSRGRSPLGWLKKTAGIWRSL